MSKKQKDLKYDMAAAMERAIAVGFTKEQAAFLAEENYSLFLLTALNDKFIKEMKKGKPA